jgi:hypothetical protein
MKVRPFVDFEGALAFPPTGIPAIGWCLPERKAGMKRARFSEEQIISILREAEGGTKVTELCRRHGISDATFYTWRSK